MINTLRRPQAQESSDYFKTYINKVEGDDVLSTLRNNQKEIEQFLQSLSDDQWNHAYAPGKWTIKEIMIHIIDTERIMAYRALRIARNDQTPMPGFEQDPYIANAFASNRSSESIIEEYVSVRSATLTLFKNLEDAAFDIIGTASNGPFSPLALAYIIAGHELHHMQILRERYLS